MSSLSVNAYFPALSREPETGDASSTEHAVKPTAKADAETPSLRTILRSPRGVGAAASDREPAQGLNHAHPMPIAMPLAFPAKLLAPAGRKAFGVVLAVLVALSAAGCRNASAQMCPILLSQLESRLAEQGMVRDSEKFRTQLASAARTCQDDPEAFGALLARTGP